MLSLWFVFSLCNLFSSHRNHYLSLCGNFPSLLFVSVVFFCHWSISFIFVYSVFPLWLFCISVYFFVSLRSFCVSLLSLLSLCRHFASLCSRLLSLSFFHLFVYCVCVFVSLWLFIYLLVGFFISLSFYGHSFYLSSLCGHFESLYGCFALLLSLPVFCLYVVSSSVTATDPS